MSLVRIGPRKLRRVQRAVGGEPKVLRALVASHAAEYWMWQFVTGDHRHGWFDSRTGCWGWYGPSEEWCVSSCSEFPDFEERRAQQDRHAVLERLRNRVNRMVDRCAKPPEVCHAGRPWDAADLAAQIRQWGEPLPQVVIATAAECGIDPHMLDWHVEAVHGFEPHDVGYPGAVESAAQCVVASRCLLDEGTLT